MKTNPEAVKDEQERISFIKMEYFLYGVVEADLLIEQIKCMETTINEMTDRLGEYQEQMQYNRAEIQSMNRERPSLAIEKRRQTILEDQNEKEQQIISGQTELESFRIDMSMKECELLQIFRELMSCDFYVPEHHFDRQLKEERKERKLKQESYNIPLTVFWRPVETKDLKYEYEPN